MTTWHPEQDLPSLRGWYEIERADGSRCVRAYNNGVWWIPLKDGWLAGLPSGFHWREPVAPMGEDVHRSPFEESEEVARAILAGRGDKA